MKTMPPQHIAAHGSDWIGKEGTSQTMKPRQQESKVIGWDRFRLHDANNAKMKQTIINRVSEESSNIVHLAEAKVQADVKGKDKQESHQQQTRKVQLADMAGAPANVQTVITAQTVIRPLGASTSGSRNINRAPDLILDWLDDLPDHAASLLYPSLREGQTN